LPAAGSLKRIQNPNGKGKKKRFKYTQKEIITKTNKPETKASQSNKKTLLPPESVFILAT